MLRCLWLNWSPRLNIKIIESNRIALYNLGVLEGERGNRENEKRHYMNAAGKDHPRACYNLGCIIGEEGGSNLAIQWYYRAINLVGNTDILLAIDAHHNLACAYEDDGDNDNAIWA